MTRAQDLLRSIAATQARTADTRGTIEGLMSMLQARKAVQGVASSAPVAPTAGKSPHSMGDGHGHDSQKEVSGLNKEFNSNLSRLINDAPGSVKIGSGYRSMAQQQVLYDRWQRKVPGQAQAAPPGKSNHNHGLAADLTYANSATKAWVHANASNYGLRFPMGFEPWHIEPINAKSLRGA